MYDIMQRAAHTRKRPHKGLFLARSIRLLYQRRRVLTSQQSAVHTTSPQSRGVSSHASALRAQRLYAGLWMLCSVSIDAREYPSAPKTDIAIVQDERLLLRDVSRRGVKTDAEPAAARL